MTEQRQPERGSPAGIGMRLLSRRFLLAAFFAAVVLVAALIYLIVFGLDRMSG